jgi:hypothetical protein
MMMIITYILTQTTSVYFLLLYYYSYKLSFIHHLLTGRAREPLLAVGKKNRDLLSDLGNWGNWQYASGVGPDPREDRYFNVIKQATVYDPDCDFIRLWIPELSVLSNEVLHNIGLLTEELRITHGISDSIYPRPIASLIHSSFKPESKKKLKQRLKSGGIPKSRNG